MFEIALKIVAFLALAALIGFVTAWLLRGLRMKSLYTEVEAQKTRMLEADRRAMLHQTELAGRDKRIGILDNDLLEEKKRFAELFAEFQKTDHLLAQERESAEQLRAQLVNGASGSDGAARPALPGEVQALETKIAQLEEDLRECAQGRAQLHARLAASGPVPTPYAGTPPRQFTELPAQIDDLKHIYGVGPILEKLLQKLGIYLFKQVALWSEQDIDFFDAQLEKFHGRIRREGWVRSALEEHYKKYGEWLGEGEPAITKPETNR
jgi:predicted flap endonuclease-1-like 5' DNA nuclease